jgi:hypothetical protein
MKRTIKVAVIDPNYGFRNFAILPIVEVLLLDIVPRELTDAEAKKVLRWKASKKPISE